MSIAFLSCPVTTAFAPFAIMRLKKIPQRPKSCVYVNAFQYLILFSLPLQEKIFFLPPKNRSSLFSAAVFLLLLKKDRFHTIMTVFFVMFIFP
jgi:hypothetical protein